MWTALILTLALPAWGASPASYGQAVAGTDAVRVQPPGGARVEAYENAGYRLEVDGAEVTVHVVTGPIGSAAPFVPPRRPPKKARSEIDRLAWALTTSSDTTYEASSRILDWVSRHVAYNLDRELPQSAEAVLARRDGYCTGVARLSVALLRSAGIEAREVPGWVVGEGYHRWIEVRLADRGWLFSDPLRSHHFVPATYVRLASERLRDAGDGGRLLDRDDRLRPDDVFPLVRAGVRVRRNGVERRAAALHVEAGAPGGGIRGQATLEGKMARYVQDLVDGRTSFVGLAPGRYHLRLTFVSSKAAAPEGSVDLEEHREIELIDLRPTFLHVHVERSADTPRAPRAASSKPGEQKR